MGHSLQDLKESDMTIATEHTYTHIPDVASRLTVRSSIEHLT